MRGLLLRAGLRLADLVVRLLPAPVAYGLADLCGRAWHRLAGRRRALVTASLTRVSLALGRPTDAASMRALVRQAFVEHARYYLEVLRAPHYPPEWALERVTADEWDRWAPELRSGAVVASLHFGNFEPFGYLLGASGLEVVAPIEEIEPPELFAFLRRRRGAGLAHVTVIPVAQSRRPLVEALRAGKIAAIIADRDLEGDGIPVEVFGHATTIPAGPATLAVMTGRPLVAAVCLRTGPDRFRGRAWHVEAPRTGDRRADIRALTAALAARYEEAIALAPEQWWATFQPYWSDQRAERAGEQA